MKKKTNKIITPLKDKISKIGNSKIVPVAKNRKSQVVVDHAKPRTSGTGPRQIEKKK